MVMKGRDQLPGLSSPHYIRSQISVVGPRPGINYPIYDTPTYLIIYKLYIEMNLTIRYDDLKYRDKI